MTLHNQIRFVQLRAVVMLSGLFFVAACGGGGDGDPLPEPVATLTPLEGNGQTDTPGAVVPVSVRVTNNSGAPAAGVTVNWNVASGGGSVSPATSVTDASGTAFAEWTLGSAAGTQTLTAAAGEATTTFTATLHVTGNCTSPLTLGVGDNCLASPAAVANLQISAGATAGEYVAIPYLFGGLTRARTNLNVIATGVTSVVGPPNPSLSPVSPSFTRIGSSSPAVLPDLAFERALRRRERRDLPQRVPGARARREDALAGRLDEPAPVSSSGASASLSPTAPSFVTVGQTLTLNASSSFACTNPVNKTGTVRAVSANAAIIEDAENPSGGFTQTDYDQILQTFESLVYPVDTTAFGKPTDIDGNNQIFIFYTVEVNKLSNRSSNSFVGGFFFSRDLFPKTAQGRLQACPTSNVAEMFYMLAPDPSGQFGSGGPGTGRIWTTAQIRSQTIGTIAHEFQHLINSARRLYVTTGASWPEEAWMEEGLSHMAEELLFYSASGLSRRANIDSTMLRSSQAAVDAANAYMVANLGRFNTWIKNPSAHSPFGESSGDDDLETRGAAWSFLRYAADRRGSSDGDTWRRLANGPATGLANYTAVFGQSVSERFRDWAVANYTDDAIPTATTPFVHRSWNYRSVLPLLRNPSFYALATRPLTDGTSQSFELVEGGAAYLRFGVAASSTATLRITGPNNNPPGLPSGLSVWIMRTK